jgi:hypothetical protein
MIHSYLSAMASAYIPFMALLSLALLVVKVLQQSQSMAKWLGIFTFIVIQLGFAYAMMLLDAQWHLWLIWQADYSTHTAVSTVFLVANIFLAKPIKVWLLGTWVGYLVLMVFMHYHTPWDIATTLVYQALAILIMRRWWQHY